MISYNSVTFSVLIPTYKRIDYLKRAINNVLKQKIKIAEIIIIDDEPSKKVESLINQLSKENNKIKIIYSKNLSGLGRGAYNCKNFAFNNFVTGTYMAFLDDDDFWDEKYLENALKYLNKNNADLSLSNYIDYYNEKYQTDGEKSPPKIINVKDILIFNPGILQSNFIIKTSLFGKLGGFDTYLEMSCDKDLFLRAYLENAKYVKIPERYVYYQIHKGNWSTTASFDILNVRFKFYKKHYQKYRFIDHLKFFKFSLPFFLRGLKKILLK